MSITPTISLVYVSDRGDKFEVSDMEISHLVNVIGHHQEQIRTLQTLNPHPKLRERMEMLKEVITLLVEELTLREVSINEYFPYE